VPGHTNFFKIFFRKIEKKYITLLLKYTLYINHNKKKQHKALIIKKYINNTTGFDYSYHQVQNNKINTNKLIVCSLIVNCFFIIIINV